MVEIDIVRHGQTQFNVEKRVQGLADSELTAQGIADAQALGRGFKKAGISFDQAYSSDRKRAVKTAELVLASATPNLAIDQTPLLREEDYGKYEGWETDAFARDVFNLPTFRSALDDGLMTLEEIADATYAANMDENPNTAENTAMLMSRFNQFFNQVVDTAEANQQQRVLVVTHGTITVMWLRAIGYPVADNQLLHNASVTRLISKPDHQFQVERFDDLSYVELGK